MNKFNCPCAVVGLVFVPTSASDMPAMSPRSARRYHTSSRASCPPQQAAVVDSLQWLDHFGVPSSDAYLPLTITKLFKAYKNGAPSQLQRSFVGHIEKGIVDQLLDPDGNISLTDRIRLKSAAAKSGGHWLAVAPLLHPK